MYRSVAAIAAVLALWAPASLAHAGVYADDLAKCLVKSSTAADQERLVVWVFTSVSAHPAVQPYARVTEAQQQDMNQQGARMFERLLTVDCRAESVAALKYEGTTALASSFSVLGQVAMRSLMSDPKVQHNMAGVAREIDKSKIEALGREAGVNLGPAASAK